jgi:hypothetical protein
MQTPGRRRAAARPLADFVRGQIDPLVARQGFGEAAMILRWREIAGERIAAICAPERLKRAPRDASADGARLILRVEPGFGLEAQHLIPLLIERINAFLGWRCVARITIRQAAISDMRAPPARAAPRPADPAARARAEAITAALPDAALRAALIRLGENALGRAPKN